MARPGAIAACIFLLVLLQSVAADTSIFSNWVYPGDTPTIKGRLYAIEGSKPEIFLLKEGSDDYLLAYRECRLSLDGLRRFCYTGSDYMQCERGNYTCPKDKPDCCPYDVAHIKYAGGKALWGAKLEIYEIVSSITISRKANATKIGPTDSVTVTLNFTNKGDEAITGARYVEGIAAGFEVIEKDELLQYAGENLTLKLNINPKDTKTFTYRVRPLGYTGGNFTGNLSYTFRDGPHTLAPTVLSINVQSPFVINLTAPATLSPGQAGVLNCSIRNTDTSEPMEAIVRFTGLTPVLNATPEGLTADAGTLRWQTKIAAGKSQNMTIPLIGKMKGSYKLGAEAVVDIDGETYAQKLEKPLSVTFTPIVAQLKAPAQVRSGARYHATLNVTNSNANMTLRDVSAVIGDRSAMRDRLAPGEHARILDVFFDAPQTEREQRVSITASGSYRTGFETLNFSLGAVVLVKPAAASYLITQTLSAKQARPGDNVSVTVKVKSQEKPYVTLLVFDELSGIVPEEGLFEKEMSLKAGEEREAYTYRFIVPLNASSGPLLITTALREQESGEEFAKSVNLSVIGGVNRTAENATAKPANATAPPSAPSKDDRGIFRRVIDGVTDFFSDLF